MRESEESFERYLREFQPRRPQVLPDISENRVDWRRWAAAAAMLVVVGTASWLVTHNRAANFSNTTNSSELNSPASATARRFSLVVLSRMAIDDPKRLDEELTIQSRQTLPDFRGEKSTLRVLAKE